jgi:hypothetical protein
MGAGMPWSRAAKRAPVEGMVGEISELLVPAHNYGQRVQVTLDRVENPPESAGRRDRSWNRSRCSGSNTH